VALQLVHSPTIHEPAYVGFVTAPARASFIVPRKNPNQPTIQNVPSRRRGSGVATIDIIMTPAAPINAAMVVDNATFAMNRTKR
jgi:hypothetical protein